MQHALKVLAGRNLLTLMCQALLLFPFRIKDFPIQLMDFLIPPSISLASTHSFGNYDILWQTGAIISCLDDKQNQIMAALVFD